MSSEDSIVAVVALIISVIALVGAILQLLQQYLSSAEGYKNCGEKVMGQWALSRNRRFRVTELRFETQFEAPVIFVCPPSNVKGPLGERGTNTPLWHISGTAKSEEETRTPSVETERANDMKDGKRQSKEVHTADNERANWFIMLQALHAMERNSQAWQENKLAVDRTKQGPKRAGELPEKVAPWDEHSVVAAVQPKRKSWDVMPSEVRKPYATTTMCHLIEMVAMLGLHWREFDRSSHKYHAEGNGYLLTGHDVNDLGIMFTFQIYGENTFEQHRIIPQDEIKYLAFGNVSTIYRPAPPAKGKKAPYDVEDPKNSEVLQFGSTTELAESLTHYGCNAKTINYFRDDKKKHGHLYPVIFEVLGMVAKSVYIPDTYFRFVPNPTTFSWNRKNFSLRKLLLEFNNSLKDSDLVEPTLQIQVLGDWSDQVASELKDWQNEDEFSLSLLSCLHKSIQNCDEYLAPSDPKMNEIRFKWVKLVVREHVQEVMKMLNEPRAAAPHDGGSGDDSSGDDSTLASRDRRRASSNNSNNNNNNNKGAARRSAAFEDLSSAAPEVRNAKLIEIYFTTVLAAVRANCPASLRKRTTAPYVTSVASRSDVRLMSSSSPPPPPAGNDDDEKSARPRSGTPVLMVRRPEAEAEADEGTRSALARDEELAGEVWCTLVFRMLCWLLLHDFHKKDVQISKSELFGSRLPVYIA